MAEVGYTIRSRRGSPRSRPEDRQQEIPSRFALGEVEATPAVPSTPPTPLGDLSTASAEVIGHALLAVGSQSETSRVKRRRGIQKILDHLSQFPGLTWQERWLASGLDDVNRPIGHEVAPGSRDAYLQMLHGVQALFIGRVIVPSLAAFRANIASQRKYATYFFDTQDDPELVRWAEVAERSDATARFRDIAKFDIASLMTTQGVLFRDVTPASLLHYSFACRRLGIVPSASKSVQGKFAGLLAWELCVSTGQFPPGTPPTLRASIYEGQKTPEQLLDRYGIKNDEVRQLLVDYLVRRQTDTDYSTRATLAVQLGGNFWSKIEELNPSQTDLHLPEPLYEQWREAIKLRQDGKPRASLDGILLPVRAMYLDLQSWALEEPERWARWAAPCPIPQSDLRGGGRRRRRIKERMDDRIRVRQPLLPSLVTHVEERLALMSDLLTAARTVAPGEDFVHLGAAYRRTDSRTDYWNRVRGYEPVRVTNKQTGEVTDLLLSEEQAFWEWAYVEVLRHTGIRVEELVELSHTSLRQYRRPNGELIALLIVAPSKADRERVIPCSPDLFHVLALIVRRQSQNGAIPAIERYDQHERTMTTPLPYLFQRRVGGTRRVTAPGTVLDALQRACARTGETVPAMRGVHFTPHDFRRLFATEMMGNGLPIHIGAALLGHLNIETTRGYTGVFADEVITQYQKYLGNRRAHRPQEEYRPASPEEWAEFEEHFDKRKVELGSCGRPYGTPCQHEHACVRCPMLHINPKMLPRLDELEADLLERMDRAEREGWNGELDGLEITLDLLRSKRNETLRMTATTERVSLGMPQIPSAVTRAATNDETVKP